MVASFWKAWKVFTALFLSVSITGLTLFVSLPFCRRRRPSFHTDNVVNVVTSCWLYSLRLRCLTTKSRSSPSFWKRERGSHHSSSTHSLLRELNQSVMQNRVSITSCTDLSLIFRKRRSIHHWQTHLTFPFFHPSIIHFDPWSLSCHCLLLMKSWKRQWKSCRHLQHYDQESLVFIISICNSMSYGITWCIKRKATEALDYPSNNN